MVVYKIFFHSSNEFVLRTRFPLWISFLMGILRGIGWGKNGVLILRDGKQCCREIIWHRGKYMARLAFLDKQFRNTARICLEILTGFAGHTVWKSKWIIWVVISTRFLGLRFSGPSSCIYLSLWLQGAIQYCSFYSRPWCCSVLTFV